METIRRKSLLYRSGLGFYCINHALGCSHGCLYPCHAFLLARRYGRVANYHEWRHPKLVENAVELLERELARRRTPLEQVHLSLSTDPFMLGYPEVGQTTLRLVELLNRHGVSCQILTKGLLPRELADRGRFSPENVYGISLVSLDEAFRARWEPHASPYRERIRALEALKAAGSITRVHLEPYPPPSVIAQDVTALLDAISFADRIFISSWNYNASIGEAPGDEAFYRRQAAAARRFCREHGVRFEGG